MIKIGNKQVNKIMIGNKEVLKVVMGDNTSSGIVKYVNALPRWNPTDLEFDITRSITSTSVTSLFSNSTPYIYFIYPSTNYVYLNATSGTQYQAFFIIFDAFNGTVILFYYDSNGVLTTQGYTGVTRVALPALTSNNQTNYGQHRYSRYINTSGKTLKWSVLNSYIYTATGAGEQKTICPGTNQNADISLNLLEDVTNVYDYSKYTTFIISPYLQGNNQAFNAISSISSINNGMMTETLIYAQKTSDMEYQISTTLVNPTTNTASDANGTRPISQIDTLMGDRVDIYPTKIYSHTQWGTNIIYGKGVLLLRVTI